MRLSTMYFIGFLASLAMCIFNAVMAPPFPAGMFFGFIFGAIMGWWLARGIIERRKGN